MLHAGHLPLENPVCRIRELAYRDARAYALGTQDSLVQSYAHLPDSDYTVESVTALIDGAIRTGWERGNLAVLTIADKQTDTFRGSLVLFDATDSDAEVGFWLAAEGRGAGLASASLELAQRFARMCGLDSLRARTVSDNTASQRVLAHAGFMEVDRTYEATPSGMHTALIHYTVDLPSLPPKA